MQNNYIETFNIIEKIAIDANKGYEVKRFRHDLVSLPENFLDDTIKTYSSKSYSYLEEMYNRVKDKETHYIQVFKNDVMKCSVFYDTCMAYIHNVDGYYELYIGGDVFRYTIKSVDELIQEIKNFI